VEDASLGILVNSVDIAPADWCISTETTEAPQTAKPSIIAATGFKSFGDRFKGLGKAPSVEEKKSIVGVDVDQQEQWAQAKRDAFKRELFSMQQVLISDHRVPAEGRSHRHVVTEVVHEILRRLLVQAPDMKLKAEKLPAWETFQFAIPHLLKEVSLLKRAPVDSRSMDAGDDD